MSGTPPYTYLELQGGNLVELLPGSIAYLYDAATRFLVVFDGKDFYEGGCFIGQMTGPPPEHPLNSYNTSYPYCRTALKYRMDDPRANPQLGQLVATAPLLSIMVLLEGCDRSQPISISGPLLEPAQAVGCGIALYPGYDPTTFRVIVEPSLLSLPARLTFTVSNGNVSKIFWIGVRDRRGGVPSGAVV